MWGLLGRRKRFDWQEMFATTVLGGALAIVYLVAGRNVLPVVAAHIAINLVIEPGLLVSAVRDYEPAADHDPRRRPESPDRRRRPSHQREGPPMRIATCRGFHRRGDRTGITAPGAAPDRAQLARTRPRPIRRAGKPLSITLKPVSIWTALVQASSRVWSTDPMI